MQPSIPSLCLAGALALTSTATHAASILNNTDFEAFALAAAANIPITSADYESGGTSPETASWAFSGVAGYLASGGASSGFWGASSRFDSSQFVVLGNFSDGATSSALVQTFTLAAAGSYDFSFDWQTGTFADDSSYGSSVGGVGLLSLRIFVPGGDDAGYIAILTEDDQQGTLTANSVALPAGELAIEIRYDFEFGSGNYNHVFLDHVKVTAIPEPSTALLASTLAGLVFHRRRR
jgi:hypothetical protein